MAEILMGPPSALDLARGLFAKHGSEAETPSALLGVVRPPDAWSTTQLWATTPPPPLHPARSIQPFSLRKLPAGAPMQPLVRRLGGLETLIVPGSADGPIVVMFHGFGADAQDLLPLSQAVRGAAGTTWLFPNAPIQVPLGPHMIGRAWFPIDMVALQAAMVAGVHRDMSHQRPPALAQVQRMATEMLAEFGAPWSRVVLAGFSQGAMLATALAIHADEPPAGVAILSGTLLDAATWQELAPKRKGLAFFQSHGSHDPLLDVGAARRLHGLLTQAGWLGDLVEYRGEHEIPLAVIDRLGTWLRSLVAAKVAVH